jgi:hypothetical protein
MQISFCQHYNFAIFNVLVRFCDQWPPFLVYHLVHAICKHWQSPLNPPVRSLSRLTLKQAQHLGPSPPPNRKPAKPKKTKAQSRFAARAVSEPRTNLGLESQPRAKVKIKLLYQKILDRLFCEQACVAIAPNGITNCKYASRLASRSKGIGHVSLVPPF